MQGEKKKRTEKEFNQSSHVEKTIHTENLEEMITAIYGKEGVVVLKGICSNIRRRLPPIVTFCTLAIILTKYSSMTAWTTKILTFLQTTTVISTNGRGQTSTST
jgi:hypothetical protein